MFLYPGGDLPGGLTLAPVLQDTEALPYQAGALREVVISYTYYCPSCDRDVELTYWLGQAPSKAKCKLHQGDVRGVYSVPAIHYRGRG